MKDNKDLEREKIDADEIRIEIETKNPFLSKLSNFWYYHKWKVIIGMFFAIVFGVGFFQMFTREDVDEIVALAAPVYLEEQQRANIAEVLSHQLPREEDGGLRTMDIYDYAVYSEDEMEEANHAETDAEGHYITYIDRAFNMSEKQSYDQYVFSTGECSVLIVSEYLYYELAAKEMDKEQGKDIRLTMGEIFGEELPAGVMPDGCGIRLADTEIYKYYEELQVLPEDTVICVLRPRIIGASWNKERHAKSVEFFKNIVTFGSEN